MKLLLILSLLAISCTQQDSDLLVTVNPTNPILVAVGSDTTVNTFDLSPPYFTLQQMSLTWKGTGTAVISVIKISLLKTQSSSSSSSSSSDSSSSGSSSTSSIGTATSLECAFSGDDLKIIFPNNIDGTTGNVVLLAGATLVTPATSKAFGCSGVGVSTTEALSYNIPAQIQVFATIVDSTNQNNTTGRAIGTTVINVQ